MKRVSLLKWLDENSEGPQNNNNADKKKTELKKTLKKLRTYKFTVEIRIRIYRNWLKVRSSLKFKKML